MANLSGRKEKILKSLIEDYIHSASPVSSSEIQTKHLPDLSSATIRNELAALEEMGYLYQPHTSAGRVPTAQAYEEYVARMMPKRKLSKEEQKTIKQHFNHRMLNIRDVLKSTAHVISEVTHYTSLACVGDVRAAKINNVKIVRLSPDTALVIVVTDMGVLKDATVKTEEDYGDEYFEALSRISTETFSGHSVKEVARPRKIINDTIKGYQKFFDAIMDILSNYSDVVTDDIVLEGASKILEYPEYSDIGKAKQMLATLDAKENILDVIKSEDESMDIQISVGKDQRLSDCAVVTVNYRVDGKSIGKAGVIGPLRMDYSKVVSVLDYVAKTVAQSALPDAKSGDEEE